MTASSTTGAAPRGRAGWALLLLGALAACGPRPEPVLSGLDATARFRNADAAAPARWPDPDWWTGFSAPELDRLMAAAMAGNFDLAAAAARVRQADAQLRVAGASLFPTVVLDTGVTQQRSVASSLSGRKRSSTGYDATLSAGYEVDFWGRIRSLTEAARQNLRASRFDVGTVLLTTEASIANTYFEVLAAREELRVQEQNLAAARRILEVIRQQVRFGTATGLDLAQQETVVAQLQAGIPSLRQTAEQGANALAVLTGQPPSALALSPDAFDRLRIPVAAPGQPADLLARRPDVQAAEATLAAANADVAAARAALLPAVTLSASGGVQSAALGMLLLPESQFFSLVAGLAQTIFDDGALRGRVALSRAQAEELLVEYRRAIVTALQDVEDALVALRETTAQETLRQEAAARAQRAYDIAESQLRAGTITLITLLNTQQTLFSARVSLVQARLARLQAAVALFRALGGGWQPQPQ
ncbi:efflux transporter outer membrane subunit [Roseomonas sp. M0104]|uniref:Efflux transporter outer membrane subunit n=1 Tax=Teichococcus coralli TaxID=2545983 RepID=A0A845BD40_9PROT|nr:efflux transporter outer membrane subunit [Pseudoroseomonas coralli]MXP64648.1 efflux transporter outer membrane subunit [Pseudoroseomonas coralli]